MSTTTPAPPRRPLACILALFALAGCWYFYTTDEEHYVLFSMFLVAQLVVHITIRSNFLDGLSIASIFFAFIAGFPLYLEYIRDNTPGMYRASQLRNVVIAMHRYHEEHNKLLTTNILNASGKPLLSWRVALLPYLGEEELYHQFKLDEPWSSPHNVKLLERIPPCFKPIRKRAPLGQTQIAALTGPGTIFAEKSITLNRVTASDGTSQTAVLVESFRFIPWTMPDDEVVDEALPPPCLIALPKTKRPRYMCFLDGSVRTIASPEKLDMKKLRSIVTWNGREAVEDLSSIFD